MRKKRFSKLCLCLMLAVTVLLPRTLAADDQAALYTSADELAGKRIGVLTGTIFDEYARENISECEIQYLNSSADLAVALDEGFIDAYLTDEPVARYLIAAHDNQTIIQILEKSDYAFCLKKDTAASETLAFEINAFLRESRQSGLLDYLKNKWLGKYEDIKTIDFSDVQNGERGILSFGTSTDTGAPFSYMKDGEYAGYEIELAVEFCRQNGYGLRITDYPFSGLLAAVQSGSVDFGASCVTVTPERAKNILFSDSNYTGGVVLGGLRAEKASTVSALDLSGASVGVLTGSVYDTAAREIIDSSVIRYYNNFTDLATAVNEGNIDCYITDEPIAKYIISANPQQKIVMRLSDDTYSLIFRKDNERGTDLCRKMNAFLRKCEDNGFLQDLENKWIYGREEERVLEYSDLSEPGKNGTLVYATSTDVGAPFCYYKDGVIAGYEIELVAEFCREYGYGLQIADYSFASIINAVVSGSADLGGACIIVTDERKESVLFSDAHYTGGMVVVMLDAEAASDDGGFLVSVWNSLEKTFLRENRWQMFLSGIGNTMIITGVSILCGTVLGFLIFRLCRKGGKVVNRITAACFTVIQRTPIIVLLMILYYIVLGRLLPNSLLVSVICFTLIFAAAFFGILKAGVGAIDKGQYEAGYALGFSDSGTFLHVILPQAARHFLPLLRAEVVTQIKATAVVGYIAVADLTRVSDIVRSRTYEAFFPLIATALIYFGLESLLIFLVRKIEFRTDTKERKPEQILKGIETV